MDYLAWLEIWYRRKESATQTQFTASKPRKRATTSNQAPQQPASPEQAKPCHLLKLPAELRLNIYEEAFPTGDQINRHTNVASAALLYTCIEIYQEALPTYEKHLDAMIDFAWKELDIGVKTFTAARVKAGGITADIPQWMRKARQAYDRGAARVFRARSLMRVVRNKWAQLGRLSVRGMVTEERVVQGQKRTE